MGPIKSHPIAGKHPLLGIIRYIKFHIIQTIHPKPRVYNWIKGLKFYAERGDAGIVGNIFYKLNDYNDSIFLIDHLKEDDLFVDIGANVGQFTLLASGISKAKTIAVEPIPETRKKLKKNVHLNNLQNKVQIVACGAGKTDEVLNFDTTYPVMSSVSYSERPDLISVRVRPLDHILEGKNPTFVKIDVEGFEYNVIKGAQKVLRNKTLKYLMIEFGNYGKKYGFSDDDVFNLLTDANFIPISYDPETKKIVKQKTYNKEEFNTLFLKAD